jgi:nitrite reductase/ring-hydroxylating ferredoxin subunit
VTRIRSFQKTGDYLTIVGLGSAVPSALTGLTDYTAIKQDSASYAMTHGLINSFAVYAYTRSLMSRLVGHRFRALWFATMGFGAVTISSWLGGEMVYGQRVGVNHAKVEGAEDWQAVLAVDELPADTPTAVEVGENTVLLFRNEDGIHAIHNVCSHAGGPLNEGEIVDGNCIQCPWHQSVFDMRDGHVVHSPATVSQPRYEVREQNGQIEVRRWDESRMEADEPMTELEAELAAS